MNNTNNTKTEPSQKGGLVIWRSPGKTIKIGEDIYVTMLSHNDHSGAKLRIQAPSDVRISRVDQIY